MKKKNRVAIDLLIVLLVCIGILHILFGILQRDRFGVLEESQLIQIPLEELPADTLYITYDRRQYQRGAMTLIIPSIAVYTPIGESTQPEALQEMPGLYEFAQLPGEGDVNTSIAGHRDIYDLVFYSLDKLGEGDYLYLLYEGLVYRYVFAKANIVQPENWDVIRPQGFPCLTLTTCDPIGTTLHRLVVQGKLVDWQEYTEEYEFLPSGSQ